MEKIVGIDLGTTNSLVAVVEGGHPVAIASAEGDVLLPSIVGFSRTGERLVGAIAKRQAISNPERTISSIKRHMGTDYKVTIDEKTYTPQEISSFILQKIKVDAEAYLGAPVNKAVITVPAYFNDSERQATKDAGTIAGLEVVRIINEPTASSMAYGLDKLEQIEIILVWDLGGGTFDVSILEVANGVFEVKATCGDMRLGGDDWDQRIMDWLVDEFKKSTRVDLRRDRVAMQRIKEASEAAKIDLSTVEVTKINLPFIAADSSGPKHLEIELTRELFEQMTTDLVAKTEEPAKKALKDSGLKLSEINKIILVGGSTRMPVIQRKVKELFGKDPYKNIDPEKVVAMGAAIQGAILAGEVKDMVLLDITSLSLGIETTGGVFTKIIDRNTQIPCDKRGMFTTVQDNQSVVAVNVLQGERELAVHNKSLGSFELRNIPPARRGVPQIEVTFSIDANGIVNASAKDLASGNKQKITIQSPTNLTQNEIEKMVKEAAVYAQEDAKLCQERQVKNKAQIEIDTAERILKEMGDRLPLDKVKKVREYIERIKNSLQTYNLSEVEVGTNRLNSLMHKVSMIMYNLARTGKVGTDGVRTDEAGAAKAEAASEEEAKTAEKEKASVSEQEILDWFKKK